MTYETLDLIADSYIPSLAIICLILILLPVLDLNWKRVVRRFTVFFLLVASAYALMLIDNYLKIWPKFGLDYSTHTAVALSLVSFIIYYKPKLKFIAGGSLIAYVLLMLYQGYHPLTDIVSTAIALAFPIAGILLGSRKR